jgi:aspartate aminotransferase
MKLTERIKQVKPSPTLSLDAKAKALKASGEDVVNLGVGEPDFNTPAHIKAAGVKAIEDNFTRYTAAGGILDLKEAVVEKFKNDNDLDYSVDQVVINCGGKHTLYNLAQALFEAGDEVIVPAPYWVSYPSIVELAGAKAVIVPTREGNQFKMTPDELREAVGPNTRALILNSPSNPTGAIYDRKELELLAEVILDKNLTVISDEIYEKLIFDGREFSSPANLGEEMKERTIIAHGVAKTYAMTGWRIGFMAGPVEAAKAVNKLQSQSTSNPCSIAQKAAVAALAGPQDEVERMRAAFEQRRDYVVDALNQIPGVSCFKPGGAFYVFPNLSSYYGKSAGGRTIQGSTDLADYILEKVKVAVVPGAAFGEEACVRMSYAASIDDLRKGVERMAEALDTLS